MKKGKLAILLTTAAVIAGDVIIASQKQSIFSKHRHKKSHIIIRQSQPYAQLLISQLSTEQIHGIPKPFVRLYMAIEHGRVIQIDQYRN